MARTFSDKPKTTWKNNGIGIANLIAKNLNNAYRNDMDTNEMAQMYYQVEYDKYKSGAGTIVRTGWDSYNLKPTYEVVDPLLIIPDPDGDYIKDVYKFIGFESFKFENEFPDEWQNTKDLPDGETELSLKATRIKTNAGVKNNVFLGRKVIYSCFTYWE